ncbi:PepSY-associated TM helix domain-containing protein [Pseudohongiella sp. SYSU M77423]|uniref:PepSY-associated TM helix domain-containing protein n=1 Tax=unclassified Pseudohongiella TaxID=2629611 RepID=UPI001F410165|nr:MULTISPECIES: PepSY-associated TM helix domain-containing protein [unclassified Pseudohongiella]MDH7943521.1 PepSY-associated TM helix domain-containing protein [Pseudohongiella sp. SYSU M77423]MEC8859205.1 PepSY-associated TM helix domain-containing protein [Pseudomonadota bacterium]
MNKLLFKVHSYLALLAVVPILIVCVTGSILVFKHEIDSLLRGELVRVEPQSQRMPLDSLLASVNQAHPDYEAVGWTLFQDPGRADQMYVMEKGTSDWSYVFLNQYTGQVLQEPQLYDQFLTDWLLELHFNFLLHDAGMLVTSFFAAILMLLGLTGLYLHRKFWKNFFTLRWKSRLVVYFSDMHKLVGVIASPVLIILAFTGIWWNVVAYLYEMQEHADGSEHHVMVDRLYGEQVSFDAIVASAEQRIAGFEATYLTLPYEPGVDIQVWGDVPTGNILTSEYASVVTFDELSGDWLSTYDIREATTGAVIVDSYRRLHFGDFAGLLSKALWALLGLSPVLLSVTGLTLWWKRRSQRQRAREKRREKLELANA